jgi:predicted nucleic acid-binding Zn ribbon protein
MMWPVKSLGELLGPALAELTERTGSTAALASVWTRVVGPVIAPHTRLLRLEDARLVVACDAQAWKDALEGEGPGLVRRLNATLGEARVRELVFVVP